METITFTCKVITPMFLAGADGKTPELRAPSIKGAMRFWWRAMRSDLVGSGGYAALAKEEGALFGGTGDQASRSSFSLRVSVGEQKVYSEERLVPHDSRKGIQKAFAPGQQFQVTILTAKKENIDKLVALFYVVSVLGGIGKRSRRGMGAFAIAEVKRNGEITENLYPDTVDQLLRLIKKVSTHFDKKGDKIVCVSSKTPDYPFIKEIEWGKPDSRILDKISRTTHDLKSQNGQVYEVSLGHASGGRFASPIYVSVKEGNIPVMTTLNTAPNRDKHRINFSLQDEFKSKIL